MTVVVKVSVGFTCPLAPLRLAVSLIAKIVEKRTTIPVLANVAIRTEADGRITFTGTDLDVWAVTSIPAGIATVSAQGETTVPAILFADILKKAGGDIAFNDKGEGRATIKSGRSTFTLNTLPASDLPAVPVMDADAAGFQLPAKTLTYIEECCSFAISTEETRYYLNGVYLHTDAARNDRLTAVATDGHKLSRLALPDVAVHGQLPDVIIPGRTIDHFDLIASTMGEPGADGEAAKVAVNVTAQRISFRTPGLFLVSKLIDGTFPDYIRVIPANNDRFATAERKQLVEAVGRVATISSERGRAVAFTFGENAEIAMVCSSPDAGSAEDSIPAEGAFDAIKIGFNARYLGDILGALTGPTVRFALADPGSPTLITDPEDDDRDVVLMPMRV